MSYFLRDGNTFRVTTDAAIDLHRCLPVGNYLIRQDPFKRLYLEEVEAFRLPAKRYGHNDRHAARILNTFQVRPGSTGVMLAGQKGSGKSLLAKTLCAAAAEDGIPTILVSSPWHGEKFNKLIQDVDQPAVILFDEFEKVYDSDKQEALLTLLDGTFDTKKLFVFTCNNKYKVDEHMRNRPGRIFYFIDFSKIEHGFIREYCEDTLRHQEHIETIERMATLFEDFNFDMLQALVEEMNRYDETPQEAVALLNMKPESRSSGKYRVSLFINGTVLNDEQLIDKQWMGNPLDPPVLSLDYKLRDKDDDWIYHDVDFTKNDLSQIREGGQFLYQNHEGHRLILTRIAMEPINYLGMMASNGVYAF